MNHSLQQRVRDHIAASWDKSVRTSPDDPTHVRVPFPYTVPSIEGAFASWQRLTTRLCLHGPVTPRIPGSLLQTLRTDVWLSETAAAPIAQTWRLGY